jgi:hypothetical protein
MTFGGASVYTRVRQAMWREKPTCWRDATLQGGVVSRTIEQEMRLFQC